MRPEQFFTPALNSSFEKRQALALLIRFILISSFFALGYFGVSFITGFLIPRYLMLLSMVLFIAQLFALKYQMLSARTTAHIFVVLCWLIIVVLTVGSGAVYSYVLPWISLIPVMALVLLSRRAAWNWSIIGLVTVTIFLFVDSNTIIPAHLLMPANDLWIASLHIGLQFIVFTLTYIFTNQQKTLIDTIEKQNDELRAREQVIEEQHRQLQIKNEGLESEIENRTSELVRNNQQLEQFNFIASHNLRSPIARILGLASLLETNLSAQDDVEIRHRLLQSTRDLDQVVRDLNTILSIRKSNEQTQTHFSLVDELKHVINTLDKDITESNVCIKTALNGVDRIMSVRPYLHSVLVNLIGNAIKYGKPGQETTINITANQQPHRWEISIQDNGIGIDLEKDTIKNKIFTLYSRFHTHAEGRGLGLYLVKTQVDALGGSISVSSTPHVGSVFTVVLPNIS